MILKYQKNINFFKSHIHFLLQCKHGGNMNLILMMSLYYAERDHFTRKMKESLHILRNRDKAVNFKVETENNVRYYSDL